jgi:hypothetical protein
MARAKLGCQAISPGSFHIGQGQAQVRPGVRADRRFHSVGRFPTDSRLPAERELTTMFNISRQTVREAIYRADWWD